MDPATQFLLGATVSYTTLGKQLGKRALIAGGLLAILPDMDIVIPITNPVDSVTYHRGFTHSLIVQSAIALPVAFGITRLWPETRAFFTRLALAVWLVLITHALLDSLTTYGTQLFWPLDTGPPTAFPSVFIIDPFYTALLLVSFVVVLCIKDNPLRSWKISCIMLTLSTAYLLLGMGSHILIQKQAEAHPVLANTRIHVQPSPFNIFYWRVLGVNEQNYYEGFTSPASQCRAFSLVKRTRKNIPADSAVRTPAVQRYEWFTDGFFTYRENDKGLNIVDLRLGTEPSYVFSFRIAERDGESWQPVFPVRAPRPDISLQDIGSLFGRIRRDSRNCKARSFPE